VGLYDYGRNPWGSRSVSREDNGMAYKQDLAANRSETVRQMQGGGGLKGNSLFQRRSRD